MRVKLGVPEGGLPEVLTLREGEVTLVGREPDEAAVDVAVTNLRVLPSALVSSNHAVLWVERDALHVRDLHSKNGTFLRVERGATATTRGAAEAEVLLASPRPMPRSALRDVGLSQSSLGAFAEALRDAVQQWLTERGYAVSVTLSRSEASDAPSLPAEDHFTVPVGEGLTLRVCDEDSGRTSLRWDNVKAELFASVHEQTARWRACHGARAVGPLALSSPLAQRALREVLDAAKHRAPLVLVGETGSGKSSLAAIYAGRETGRSRRSRASAAPFITVHCSHLDAPLAHATLFGALRGSYTSSERTQVGAVRHADGGVLFLDDIDALPLETQAKLLRFLDDGEYLPLGHGARDPLVADVRVVVGTHADLRAAVRAGTFREDLYWRLHMGAVVRVPPLRHRPEDIEQMLRQAGGDGARDESRPHTSVDARLAPAAREFLVRQYPWSGNFRECLRFCARALAEPGREPIERRRCEEILAETSLDSPSRPSAPSPAQERGDFDGALAEALAWWRRLEGRDPERFDELGRFCEAYLKSAFVAHTLDLTDVPARPDVFDRDHRHRLGCDLTTLKRKLDDYLALRERARLHG